ncbi:MAG: UDP-N-acetylmuramyl-tripeptide synthetase [Myxococcales bacterium]|nr:UDP-N-acetylmuramyl-tripeptide synthetase [Myxococcales bacterium]MCB9625761.1 UDP-N-acetylmuramyl-tripeptide synthetase [Sandaracinaceae bacterium]
MSPTPPLGRAVAPAVPEPAPGTSAAELRTLRPRLRSVGVTGTNGKTTTTCMLASIVAAAGETSARATTLGTWLGDEQRSADVSLDAFGDLVRAAVAQQVRTIAVETTSKALAAGFARVWPADVAVFTNLTRDHLDTHGSPEAYLAAKAQLFMTVPPDGAVVWNLADPCSALLDALVHPGVRRFGWVVGDVHPDCAQLPVDLRADAIHTSVDGTRCEVSASPRSEALSGSQRLAAVGAVHVQNALGAALAAAALGYEAAAIWQGIRAFPGVPGRFELVARRPLVVVDYAHTPDALARTLLEARALIDGTAGRLACVFGCGGERDQGKRPEMGRIADEHAHTVYLTNDNPRREDPERILDAIEQGAPTPRRAQWHRLPDRHAAIHAAIASATPGDAVVIAGRGHEQRQILGGGAVPFSDVGVAHEAVSQRRGGVP